MGRTSHAVASQFITTRTRQTLVRVRVIFIIRCAGFAEQGNDPVDTHAGFGLEVYKLAFTRDLCQSDQGSLDRIHRVAVIKEEDLSFGLFFNFFLDNLPAIVWYGGVVHVFTCLGVYVFMCLCVYVVSVVSVV